MIQYGPGLGEGRRPRELVIGGWTTSCGDCGYGRGSWADSPALLGKPILVPESTSCPGCGVEFDHSLNVHTGEELPIPR